MDWERSITGWTTDRLVDLPQGISRHNVRFVAFDDRTYAVKELPTQAARQDHAVLHTLEALPRPPAPLPLSLSRRGPRPGVWPPAATSSSTPSPGCWSSSTCWAASGGTAPS